MQRGRLFPQIPDYMFAPDFDARHRPAQKAHWNYTEVPLGGPTFTTDPVKPTIDYTDLSLSYEGTVVVGPRTITWSVVHRVNNKGAFVHYACKQIDDLGNGSLAEFNSSRTTDLWIATGSSWFIGPTGITNFGSSTTFTCTWRCFPSQYS